MTVRFVARHSCPEEGVLSLDDDSQRAGAEVLDHLALDCSARLSKGRTAPRPDSLVRAVPAAVPTSRSQS